MSVWFDGSCELNCDLAAVTNAVNSPGEYFTGTTALMPGLTSSELIEAGSDFVTIRTNEGTMHRTGVAVMADESSASIEFDELYKAGSKGYRSHIKQSFAKSPKGVSLHIVISDVVAPGFLGLMYRLFGSSSIGKAYLSANTTYFSRSHT